MKNIERGSQIYPHKYTCKQTPWLNCVWCNEDTVLEADRAQIDHQLCPAHHFLPPFPYFLLYSLSCP